MSPTRSRIGRELEPTWGSHYQSQNGQDTTSIDEHVSTSASDLNDSTSEEQVDGATSNGDVDSDPTNQLVEAIMNEVNEALSASGIFSP